MKRTIGFTLIELLVVILIVGVLAAASVPMIRGNIDRSKWAEANATAGTIKNATRVYFLETGDAITGNLGNASIQQSLNFHTTDLTGTYFVPSDYQIDSVNANGVATITVTASQGNAPPGSKTLTASGDWQ